MLCVMEASMDQKVCLLFNPYSDPLPNLQAVLISFGKINFLAADSSKEGGNSFCLQILLCSFSVYLTIPVIDLRYERISHCVQISMEICPFMSPPRMAFSSFICIV